MDKHVLRILGRQPQDKRINGEWFVNLDSFVDIARFEALHSSIALGIAKSMQYAEPIVIGALPAQFDMRVAEVEQVVKQKATSDPVLKQLIDSGATRQVIYDYVKYAHRSAALGKKILLRTYKQYHSDFGQKHLSSLNETTPAADNFPELMQFISDMSIFSEVGRVIVFLTERNAAPEIHCDYADRESRKDQFVWLSPKRGKKFFVLDTEFNKHYLTGIANTFDNATWHGGDPVPYATYSVRVDGLFTQEFLHASGLDSHFSS